MDKLFANPYTWTGSSNATGIMDRGSPIPPQWLENFKKAEELIYGSGRNASAANAANGASASASSSSSSSSSAAPSTPNTTLPPPPPLAAMPPAPPPPTFTTPPAGEQQRVAREARDRLAARLARADGDGDRAPLMPDDSDDDSPAGTQTTARRRFAEHFTHIGAESRAQTRTGPSAPQIRSQRLCI